MCGFLVEMVLVPNLPTCQNCPGYWMGPWLETKRNFCPIARKGHQSLCAQGPLGRKAEVYMCHREVSFL